MATSERPGYTAGFMPAVNDLLAVGVVFALYVTRWGLLAEGESAGLFIQFTADFLVPVLGAVWLLAVPTLSLYERIGSE